MVVVGCVVVAVLVSFVLVGGSVGILVVVGDIEVVGATVLGRIIVMGDRVGLAVETTLARLLLSESPCPLRYVSRMASTTPPAITIVPQQHHPLRKSTHGRIGIVERGHADKDDDDTSRR